MASENMLCPNCGEPVARNESKCPHCDRRLERVWTRFNVKSLWAWLLLMITPITLVALVFLWTDYREIKRVESETVAETNRANILQIYLDDMTRILLDEDLGDRKVRSVAQVLTLTMLHELDADRRIIALRFLEDTRMTSWILTGVTLIGEDLQRAHLDGANLHLADLRWTDLRDAKLRGANLEFAKLQEADMWQAKLTKANLRNADMFKAELKEADLYMVDAERAIFVEANLQGATLKYADLTNANMHRANLADADLNRAIMYQTYLSWANLQGAFLNGAKMVEANLQGVNATGAFLSRVDLQGADLREANLDGAWLDRANLNQAKYSDGTIWPEGFDPVAAGAVYDSVIPGCFMERWDCP